MNKQASGSPVLNDQAHFFQAGKGWNIQSVYLFKNNFEIARRYTIVDPSSEIKLEGLENKVMEYTLGVSKYFMGHNLLFAFIKPAQAQDAGSIVIKADEKMRGTT